MKAIKYLLVLILMLAMTMPAMAGSGPGGPGGGGTKPEIPDTGELYGDLYVILRDEDGVPILDGNGCIQPISTVGSMDEPVTLEIYDSTGTDVLFTTTAIAGEPFALAFYTDATIELDVECELTEDMATWVETVDFGRLNLGRAPEGVIAHAFDEAINKMNVATDMKLDPAGRLVLTLPDEETGDLVDKTIDAPAENLALYIKMMTDGDWITVNTNPIVKGGPPEGKGPPEGDGPSSELRPVLNESAIALLANLWFDLGNPDKLNTDLTDAELTLAASLLAAAADKTGRITLDKVIYINSVYGINQAGSLPGEVEDKSYFDFSDYSRLAAYSYDRATTYSGRGSVECEEFGSSYVWVLQPELDDDGEEVQNHFVTTCMDILGYDSETNSDYNAVRFTNMVEEYTLAVDSDGNLISGYDFVDNVRAFAQAADDALQVIEYIHNYKVPEELYP